MIIIRKNMKKNMENLKNWLSIMWHHGFTIIGTFPEPYFFECFFPYIENKIKEVEFKNYKNGWLMVITFEQSNETTHVPYYVNDKEKKSYEEMYKNFIV